MTDKIYLARHVRIGDRVKVNMDKEARSWGRKGPPDGTEGTVVRFNHRIDYTGRIYEFGREPGVYEVNTEPVVMWDGNVVAQDCSLSTSDLSFINMSDAEYKARLEDKVYNEAFQSRLKIGELPSIRIPCANLSDDTEVEEYDIVEVLPRSLRLYSDDVHHQERMRFQRVLRIDWHRIGEMRNDGITPMPIFHTQPFKGEGPQHCLDVTEVQLHKRGNVWWWNRDKSRCVFADLKEEASFAKHLGLTEELRNPNRDNKYYWPDMVESITAVRSGYADAINVESGFFGSGPRPSLQRFKDRNLGERVRNETIKGFSRVIGS